MSASLSALLVSPDRHCFLSGTITYLTGETIPFSGDQALSFSMSEGAADGLLLGGAFSASCSLTLDNSDQAFTAHRTPYGAQVRASLCAGEESAPLAEFTVSKVVRRENDPRLTLSGSDALGTAFVGAFQDDFTYPLSLGSLAQGVAAQAGFPLDTAFPNAGFLLPARPDWGDITLRQALSFIACAAGCFFRISRDGQLQCRPVRSSAPPFLIGPENTLRREFGDQSFGPLKGLSIACKGAPRDASPLTVQADEMPLHASNTLSVSGNPLFPYEGSHTLSLARALLNALSGWRIAKARVTWRGDPELTLGDPVRIEDVDGSFTGTVVTGQHLSFCRGFSMQSDCFPPAAPSPVGRLFTPAGAVNAAMLDGSLDGAIIRNGTVAAGALIAGSVTAQQLAARSVTADKLDAGSVTAEKIASNAVQARHISAGALEAVDAHLESADIDWAQIGGLSAASADVARAEISQAKIGWGQVRDLIADTALITRGSGDKLYIKRLSVDAAQVVDLTVGSLTVKASDGNYYALDADNRTGYVTARLTAVTDGEIAAGQTVSGKHIIETNLSVSDLNAASATAAEALINKLTAGRVDTDAFFAREATIRALNALDITGNRSLRLLVQSQGKTYSQWDEPTETEDDPLTDGDLWDRNIGVRLWSGVSALAWGHLADLPWSAFIASRVYVRRNQSWLLISDLPEQMDMGARLTMTEEKIALHAQGLASIQTDGVARLQNAAVTIDPTGIDMEGGEISIDAGAAFRATSGGTVEIFAQSDDSYLKFGGTQENPHFSVGEGGSVRAASVTADQVDLTSGGLLKTPAGSPGQSLYVGTSQPQGHGIVWIRPNAESSVDFRASAVRTGLNGQTASASVTLQRSGSALAGSTCTYGLKFSIYNYSGSAFWNSVTVTARRSDGTGEITIYQGSPAYRKNPGDYITVDTLDAPGAELLNLTDASAIILTVTVNKSAATQARFDSDVTLRCRNQSSPAAQACDVLFIP